MDTNDDFHGKELNLNCFYMPTNYEQTDSKRTIVDLVLELEQGSQKHNVMSDFW